MRRPTPASRLFAYYYAKLRGEKVISFDGDIHCGWYKTTLIKHGPWVPALVFIDRDIDPETGELTRDERLICHIHGIEQTELQAMEKFPMFRAISRAEFDELEARWTYMAGDPKEPIDLAAEPTLPEGYYFNA